MWPPRQPRRLEKAEPLYLCNLTTVELLSPYYAKTAHVSLRLTESRQIGLCLQSLKWGGPRT